MKLEDQEGEVWIIIVTYPMIIKENSLEVFILQQHGRMDMIMS